MEKPDPKLNLQEMSIFDTYFRDSILPFNVFGLGKSSYSPLNATTNLNLIRVPDDDKVLFNKNEAFPFLSKIYNHENAHSLLSSYTTCGGVLRSFNKLKISITNLIFKKMIEIHGRFWIPVFKYSSIENSNEQINHLLSSLVKVIEVENKLIDGWKISHEMFAFVMTIKMTGLVEESSNFFDIAERSDLVRSWYYLMLLNDTEESKLIVSTLREYCLKNGIDWENLNKEDLQKLKELSEDIFKENDRARDIFCNWVDISSQVNYGFDSDSFIEKKQKIHNRIREEISKEYGNSKSEHLKALETLMQAQNDNPNNLGILYLSIILSSLFAPKISSSQFLTNGNITRKIESIDSILEKASNKDLIEVLNNDDLLNKIITQASFFQEFLQKVNHIQKEAGWVAFDEKNIKKKNILVLSQSSGKFTFSSIPLF